MDIVNKPYFFFVYGYGYKEHILHDLNLVPI